MCKSARGYFVDFCHVADIYLFFGHDFMGVLHHCMLKQSTGGLFSQDLFTYLTACLNSRLRVLLQRRLLVEIIYVDCTDVVQILVFSTQLQNPSCCFNYPMKSPSSSPTPLFKLILSPPVWSGTLSMCHLHLCAFSPIVLCIVCVGNSGLSRGLMETLCRRFLDDAQLNRKQIHHVMFYFKTTRNQNCPYLHS